MKKSLFTLVLVAATVFMSSCSVTAPVAATSNPIGSKVGRSKTMAILLFHFDGGDAGIQSAAKNGGISKVSTVDFKSSVGLLGLWRTYECIVTGE